MTDTPANPHDGKVVSMVGDKITMICDEGNQHCYTMNSNTKVTSDGHAGKASDLKAGTHVRVTTHKDDKSVATAVESGKHMPATAHKV